MFVVKRSQDNPILVPNKDHYWEEFAVFNMCPVWHKNKFYCFYRAISAVDRMNEPHQISTIGMAKSRDGLHFTDRDNFLTPVKEWEQYGCEDPRATFFEGKFYIFYTAISRYPIGPEGIKVAVAVSKDLKKIDERHFVTPFNAKAMTLFPKRINGKIVVMFSYNTDKPPAKMVFAYLDKIEDLWSPLFWENWELDVNKYLIDPRRNEYDHVEVGAPPLYTKNGWMLVYSHIQNYFSNPENLPRVFGIEVILLDLKNPLKIIGRTKGPILSPREQYELSGYIPDVIFPSGATLIKDKLNIYYGAADTTVCVASVNFSDLINSIREETKDEYSFKRFSGNPIISPLGEVGWEAKATFNPASIDLGGKVHILYRTLSDDNTSSIGYAVSTDGFKIDERLNYPIYVPREDFELKKINNANSGCEDPRLVKIGTKIYICYTAFDGIGPPRVALSSITQKNFLSRNWIWEKPFLITPKDLDDKDTCIFPEKFKNGYCILHRINNEICSDFLKSLDSHNEMVKKCIRIIGPRINMWDSAKVGISAPPIKTKYGWLLIYHGVSKTHSTYRVGVLLLDLKDPAIVLARSTDAIFEPEKDYEKLGIVNNVVFPCGIVVRKGLVYIYYGGGDRVVGVATMKLNTLLKALVNGAKLSE